MEKRSDELSPIALKGLNKFTRLRTSRKMIEYGNLFDKKTGKNSYNV